MENINQSNTTSENNSSIKDHIERWGNKEFYTFPKDLSRYGERNGQGNSDSFNPSIWY